MQKSGNTRTDPNFRLSSDDGVVLSKYSAPQILTWNPKLVVGATIPIEDYRDLKREVEEDPNDLTYPMRAHHIFNPLVHPQIRGWLNNLGLAWVEEADGVFEVEMWNLKNVENYLLFATYVEASVTLLEASDIIGERDRLRKVNRIRRVTFRRRIPVPEEQISHKQIISELNRTGKVLKQVNAANTSSTTV